MRLWQPVSGCDDRCRDGADDRAVPGLAVLRIAAAAVVFLIGFLVVPLLRGAGTPLLARGLLAALGVKVERRGPAVRPGSLLVANHVSWLDVLVLAAATPVRLVAKCEVGRWPAIGFLAGRAGAIFLDRTRPRTLPSTVAEVAAVLRTGRSVAAFPEATTFCGNDRGRFRPAMFQAAIDAGAPVVPAAITYDSTAAAFIGDDDLWASVRRVAGLRSLSARLVTAPSLRPDPGSDRRLLARAAQSSMGVSGYRLAA